MVDDQIEKEVKSRATVEADMLRAKAEYERKERELQLVDWSLGELNKSRSALLIDRSTNPDVPTPRPGRTPAGTSEVR
jgi:hypothetical protein